MGESLEIGTYLRGLGRRAVLAGVLIVVAIGGPVVLVLRQPVDYVAIAAVRVPSLSLEAGRPIAAEASGAGEGSQLAADLSGILGLMSTRTALAAKTGVSVGALKDGLTVTRAGSEQFVDVTFRDTERARARQVARAAAAEALEILTKERLVQATETQKAALQRLEAIPKDDSAERPLAVYVRARADVARLEQLVIVQLAAGDSVGAASARRSLDEARNRSSQAAEQVAPFQRVETDREPAQEALTEANKELARRKQRSKAIEVRDAVGNGPVRRELPVKRVASAAIGGGLAAGVLCFGLITAAEVGTVLKRRARALA